MSSTSCAQLLVLPCAVLDAECNDARASEPVWDQIAAKVGIFGEELAKVKALADSHTWDSEDVFLSVTAVLRAINIITRGAGNESQPNAEADETFVYFATLLYDSAIYRASRGLGMLPGGIDDELTFGLRQKMLVGSDNVAGHACRLVSLYILGGEKIDALTVQALLEWIDLSLEMYPERDQRTSLALAFLGHILRVGAQRSSFLARRFGLQMICTKLIFAKSVQIEYHALFAVWLLSFDKDAAAAMQSSYNVITALLDVCKTASKDKIVRMCIGTWRNFLKAIPKIAVPVMIGGRVLPYLESGNVTKIADEEVQADVAVLRETLSAALQSLNSFDEYASEIKSGKLDWSPPHKSDLFWKDNAARLQANDCEILRLLTHLLATSSDPLVLAVACNDVGMYVSHHTVGRKNLEAIGTKARIMALIYHEHSEVRFQALSAMQKYMKNMWN